MGRVKRSNIQVIGIPAGEKKEIGAEKSFLKNNGWKLPNLGKRNIFTDSRN